MSKVKLQNLIIKSVVLTLMLSVAFAVNFSAGVSYAEVLEKGSENETNAEYFYKPSEEIIKLAKFDPRSLLTPVKDQGASNLCWAYSTINASEGSILKNKLGNKDTLRLNPNALAYRKYVRSADVLNNTASYYDRNAPDWYERAGDISSTPSILSMWQGPIAYDKPANASVHENGLYRLESANLINSGLSGEDRINEIKRAIAKYGSVTASCYYDGGVKEYYNDNEIQNGIPHAITLVGWDDTIDSNKFGKKVVKNGGWLVKNSYSDNGYFWLTYESKIAQTTAWTFTYAPKEAYDYNYYYDNDTSDNPLLKDKQYANVYEAKMGKDGKAEYVEAVNVGFYGNDVTVKVKVYTNLSGWGQTAVESGTLASEKTETFKYGGYNTVRLDNPVKVAKGSYYSVVVEVSNTTGDAYVSVAPSGDKKPSYRKVYDGYDYVLYGGAVARIKAYTKLKSEDEAAHNYIFKERVEATCVQEGIKAHYYCQDCGKYFDESKNEKTLEELTIAATGVHDWNAWVSNGNGTHTRTCNNGSHNETENCSGGTATCENKAVCSVCGAEYGTKLGHDWGKATYTWTDNTCKAERVCKHDSAHIESETVIATETVIKAATCKEKGKMKYTAMFVNTAFAVQEKDVDIDFAEHTYGTWIEEIPATTENFGTKGHYECSVCGKYFDKDGNEITDLRIAKIGTHVVTVKDGAGETNTHYKSGDTVTIKATVPTGKHFVKWSVVTGISLSAAQIKQEEITFTMPDNDVTITAQIEDSVYSITVTDGTSTSYTATYQQEVTVTANEPDVDEFFDKWEVTGLDTTGMDLTKTEIKFQMPAGNVTFKATYLRVTKYGIVIVDGTKDKEVAKAGEIVTITAGTKEGKVFDKWTCETAGVTIEFASTTSARTTFVMPAREIEIKAHFRNIGDAPSVEIKVDGGTGAGTYKQGESVTVTAEDKEGKEFKGWKDESGEIVSTKKSYTFTVAGEKTLTAVYGDVVPNPTPDNPSEVKPSNEGLTGGQVAGIVIGTLLFAGIGGFAIFWFAVKKKTFADLITAIKVLFTKKK